MSESILASLNLNGARECVKRAFFFLNLAEFFWLFYWISNSNRAGWARDFDGLSILGDNSSTSGETANPFSHYFIPCSYKIDEIINDRLLKVRAQYENRYFVYSPRKNRVWECWSSRCTSKFKVHMNDTVPCEMEDCLRIV